ncbi:MAG: FAD-dependent oxidoreductase [Corynebacteriales bacterium]|nr:FAD-dependent oxidoreductase [Mycobacteriales bacterium]
MENHTARQNIAVIGAGIAGLTAAYVLAKRHNVTLYEAEPRLGGHAHTHEVIDNQGRFHNVDSGFIVFNDATYPTLIRLFAELGVKSRETEMSMSVNCAGCGLQYAGERGFRGLFPSARNVANARYLALLAQIPLFHHRARALLDSGDEPGPTLQDFLAQGRHSTYFINHFIVPLVSAVWSCGPEVVGRYPARYLFAFLANHGMLSVSGSPVWRTVVGGSKRYVDLIAKNLPVVHTSAPVTTVVRGTETVSIRDAHDHVQKFDSVVIATHPDQALALLGDPTDLERTVLGAIKYSRNRTVLHTDTTLLPSSPAARASWNYHLPACVPDSGPVRVSYHMNRLQGIDSPTDYVVSLGVKEASLGADSELAAMTYAHPIYTPKSVAAQKRLPELASARTVFAGAYHGWGFHEDGCVSGVSAAAALGVSW